MLRKFPAGYAPPPHKHPSAERVVVVPGAIVVRCAGSVEKRLGPGSYSEIPANMEHAVKCADEAECVFVLASPGPFAIMPVASKWRDDRSWLSRICLLVTIPILPVHCCREICVGRREKQREYPQAWFGFCRCLADFRCPDVDRVGHQRGLWRRPLHWYWFSQELCGCGGLY